MTTTSPPAGRGGPALPSERTTAEVPQRADGVQLIGEMPGSGYLEPPALVRRSDGQMLQLTPLLYAVMNAVDGVRNFAQVAAAASETTGRRISAANVAT